MDYRKKLEKEKDKINKTISEMEDNTLFGDITKHTSEKYSTGELSSYDNHIGDIGTDVYMHEMDNSLIDAAADLGANKRQIFTKVIFPLSMPGVITGITMVFMPAVSTFVISRLLGGGQYMLLGNLIETQFTTMGDWNFGSALAIFMMIIILISMAIMNKFEGTESMEGGK